MSSPEIVKSILAAFAVGALIMLAPSEIPLLKAQTAATEIAVSSIDGGGGEMSGGSLSMDYAVAESQPIGEASSANFTLDSGFIPIIALQEDSSPSPSPTATPSVAVPTVTFWGLLLMCGVILFLSIRKGRLA